MEVDELKKLATKLDTLTELWGRYLDRQQREEDARMEDKAARAIEEGLKQLRNGNGNGNHAFTEKQEERIKTIIEDHHYIEVGKTTTRFLLSVIGAFGAGFFASAAAFILTGHWH